MMNGRGPSEVIVQIRGEQLEYVLNECMKTNLPIKHVQRNNETVTCIIHRKYLSQLDRIVFDSDCTWEVVSLSFFEKYKLLVKERIGFFIGMAVFVALMILLSQMIWKVEIRGANPALKHEISQAIEEIGVSVGKFSFLLPGLEEIQSQLLDQLEGITWVGVQKQGTTYRFEVVEQTLPKEREDAAPRHLTAKKTAVIHSIYAEKGQVLVEENELVHPGDMLISGFIGKGKHAKMVAATGKVLGETWYQATVNIPLKQRVDTLTGNVEKSYALQIGSFRLPIWGFSQEKSFSSVAPSETMKQPALFEKWNIPISLSIVTWNESQSLSPPVKREDLRKVAKERGRSELKKKISDEATILNEKILHEQSENGKVKIVIHYQVIEDITSETPIIRGE